MITQRSSPLGIPSSTKLSLMFFSSNFSSILHITRIPFEILFQDLQADVTGICMTKLNAWQSPPSYPNYLNEKTTSKWNEW